MASVPYNRTTIKSPPSSHQSPPIIPLPIPKSGPRTVHKGPVSPEHAFECVRATVGVNQFEGVDKNWFIKFKGLLESTKETYPIYHVRFTYNAADDTITTRCIPSRLYEASQMAMVEGISDWMFQHEFYSDNTNDLSVGATVDVSGFSGAYAGIFKRGQAFSRSGSKHDYTNGTFPGVVIDVSYGEPYEDLFEEAKLWLEGSQGKVQAIILIMFNEVTDLALDPPEANPTTGAVHQRRRNLWEIGDYIYEDTRYIIQEDKYGPVFLHGNVLVGRIDCTIEVWRFNASGMYQDRREIVLPVQKPPELPKDSPHATDEDLSAIGLNRTEFEEAGFKTEEITTALLSTFKKDYEAICFTVAELFGSTNPPKCSSDELVSFYFFEFQEKIERSIVEIARERLRVDRLKKRELQIKDKCYDWEDY